MLIELNCPTAGRGGVGEIAWSKRVLAPVGAGEDDGVGVEILGAPGEQLEALESFISVDDPA